MLILKRKETENVAADIGLIITVPVIDQGPSRPADFRELAPGFAQSHDLPCFIEEACLKSVVEDEAAFRLRHQSDWSERGWLAVGRVMRDENNQVFGIIREFYPAAHLLTSSSIYFELSPQSWLDFYQHLEALPGNNQLMGWLHTHAIECAEVCKNCEKNCRQSALFLSETDCTTAMKGGFAGAAQLTMVLDSVKTEKPGTDMAELFGVWGWDRVTGLLRRRSIGILA